MKGLIEIPLVGLPLTILRLRLFGAATVRRMQERKDLGGLIAALSTDDPAVRYLAVEALGGLHDPAAIPSLLLCLTGEEHSGLRWKAAEALSALGPAAVKPLITALSSADDDVRWKAALALGATRDGAAVGPLITLFLDPDRFVRGRATAALAMIGAPAVAALTDALADPDPDLRWGAAVTFGLIRDLSTLPLLIAALGDTVDLVRVEVLAAVAGFGAEAAGLLSGQPASGVPARDADIHRLLAVLNEKRTCPG
jgi:HEAT repeat protein